MTLVRNTDLATNSEALPSPTNDIKNMQPGSILESEQLPGALQ